jgi:pimeloyl-ACP methyl ester carboxylesterase
MAYVDVEGARIWYEDSGGERPLVVLVHAAAGHSGCWQEQLPLFDAAGFRVLTFDLRGFGRSQAEPGRAAEGSIAQDLETLIQRLALPRFSLVATAYGGFGGMEFALDNPDKLNALVVSTSFGGLSDPEFLTFRNQSIPPRIAQRPVQERELGASYRASNPDGMARFLAMEHASYRADGARQALRQPTTFQRLETMRVPTLIIAGEEDVLAPPLVMKMFADHIPGARFEVIAGAGHSAYWEQPRVWNGLIVGFLREALSKD